MKVSILVFPGVEELDFVGFLEVLAVANRVCGKRHFEPELVGVDRGPLRCRGGMQLVPDKALSELGEHDLLFVPGGGARSSTGVDLLMQDERVLNAIRRSYNDGRRVWSVCTGALVLGKAGLLKGKRATTHHSYYDLIQLAGARLVRERVVTDGRLTTGGGISSSIDVGLALVENELGGDVEREVRASLEYPPPKKTRHQ